MMALIIGGLFLVVILLFLGLCFASIFLPVILVLVGIVFVWKGVGGIKPLILIGVVLVIAGVVAWLLTSG